MTNLNAVDPAAVAQDAHLENADVVIGKNTIIFRRFMRNKTAVAGLGIFLALTLFSFVGGYFTQWDKETIDPDPLPEPVQRQSRPLDLIRLIPA